MAALAPTGLDSMSQSELPQMPSQPETQPQIIKKEEDMQAPPLPQPAMEMPLPVPSIVQTVATVESTGSVSPVAPPNQNEPGASLPWTDKGYLPRHTGAKRGGKGKRRRAKRVTGKAADRVNGVKSKRKGRDAASKAMNPEELKKYRSAEYTKKDQQMRTEARLKRLQEIYAHEVSGAPLDDEMKKEKLKLIAAENKRKRTAIQRAKKKQYIRDLEQRVEMFSKHIATLEMENSELRASLNKHGINSPTSLGVGGGMGMGGPQMGAPQMDPSQPQMDPNQMMMMGMHPSMMGMMPPQAMPTSAPGSAPASAQTSAPNTSTTSPVNSKRRGPKTEPTGPSEAEQAQQQAMMQQQMMAMMMGGMPMGMMGGMPGMGMGMDMGMQQSMGGQMGMQQPMGMQPQMGMQQPMSGMGMQQPMGGMGGMGQMAMNPAPVKFEPSM